LVPLPDATAASPAYDGDVDAGVSDLALRDVIERLPDGVALLDRQARVLYLNAAAARIVARPPAELVGQPLWDVVGAPIGPALRDRFDRVLAGEELVVVRSYFAKGRWYEVVAHPVGDQVFLFGRNITERLQAEVLRRQSEQRLRILLDGVKDYAIVLLDPKGQIASWNIGAERLFGYRASDILGKDNAVVYAAEDAEHARENLEDAVAAGQRQDEGQRVRNDGSRFLAEATYSALYDDLGEPSGFAVVTRDVTERRRMVQRLRTSEERLRLALDAAEVGTWEYRIREDRWIADARALAMYDVGRDEGEEATLAERVQKIHPDDRAAVQDKFERALAGGTYSAEYRLVGIRGGAERWIESHGKAQLDEDGQPFRILGAVRDITARRHYDELLRLLPGLVAHDLRSPISVIKLAAGRLLRSEMLPSRAGDAVNMILRGAEQLAQLTARLLDFTQARYGGGIPLQRTLIDLADAVRDAVAGEQLVQPTSVVDFHVEGDCHGVWDGPRLGEVAANLVGNALKHGAPDEPVRVTLRGDADHVFFTVHNTGPPIPVELLPILYDPFRRLERSDRRGPRSYGLGLYIAREIVLAHGGAVDVTSTQEAGTTFTVRLPRGTVAVDAPQPSP
jgi:PAS domain S-box-containing protein